ncbi:aromatic hydrocarbon degradation protein [Marinobacter sp. NP-4(2019)]|uniref:OmpP1/FadL family transporter n=1 Tax=Marinobacter sp. NP-4(2019) TaxID=2488665 RepID=UPI000FC3C983|nr:outer membrane protein transport protein [Marinobacter sp. NP-4(2019)]AZT82684.1 aromatic hydrocarbon degradation protein [Marinobacter sp. NP-4(2019)]
MRRNKSTLRSAIRLVTVAAAAAPTSVMAGGFALNEQSASAMGVANAGTAANPENATTVLFNPAGMSQLSGTNLSFGAAVLDIDAEAKEGVEATNQLGLPVQGSRGGDIADPAVLPNLYMTHEVSDAIDVGFGIHAPFGLAADYDDDFAGRYFADETELTAISFSPSIAVNNGNGLSMGAGINIIYAEGKLTRFLDNSLASVAVTAPSGTPDPGFYGQGHADIEGDDVGVTFRMGFLYELSERTQFGLSAQTGTELNLEGDADLTGYVNPAAGVVSPTSVSEKVKVPLAIPESIMVGARHQLTDTVTVLAGATYAKWSRFEELDIVSRETGGEITQAPQEGAVLSHVTEKWQNTWQFNLGGIWQVSPEWALKAGYAFDESPVDEEFVTARIPSNDRHWLTLGAQWADPSSGWTVDVAAGTLIFDGNGRVDERNYQHENPSQVAQLPTGTEDPSNYRGEYELDAWSAGVQVSKSF